MTSPLPVGTLGTYFMPLGTDKGNDLPSRGWELQAVCLSSRNFNFMRVKSSQSREATAGGGKQSQGTAGTTGKGTKPIKT